MRVMVVIAADEQMGQATAVVAMPDFISEDKVFCAWVRKRNPGYWKGKTDEQIVREAEYAWNVHQVESPSP
jgi:hypothetical protein